MYPPSGPRPTGVMPFDPLLNAHIRAMLLSLLSCTAFSSITPFAPMRSRIWACPGGSSF